MICVEDSTGGAARSSGAGKVTRRTRARAPLETEGAESIDRYHRCCRAVLSGRSDAGDGNGFFGRFQFLAGTATSRSTRPFSVHSRSHPSCRRRQPILRHFETRPLSQRRSRVASNVTAGSHPAPRPRKDGPTYRRRAPAHTAVEKIDPRSTQGPLRATPVHLRARQDPLAQAHRGRCRRRGRTGSPRAGAERVRGACAVAVRRRGRDERSERRRAAGRGSRRGPGGGPKLEPRARIKSSSQPVDDRRPARGGSRAAGGLVPRVVSSLEDTRNLSLLCLEDRARLALAARSSRIAPSRTRTSPRFADPARRGEIPTGGVGGARGRVLGGRRHAGRTQARLGSTVWPAEGQASKRLSRGGGPAAARLAGRARRTRRSRSDIRRPTARGCSC